jgi:hypothetical protein
MKPKVSQNKLDYYQPMASMDRPKKPIALIAAQ